VIVRLAPLEAVATPTFVGEAVTASGWLICAGFVLSGFIEVELHNEE